MTISVITVNYHTETYLPGLLQSLLAQPLVSEWLIVDNSGTVTEPLQASFPVRVFSQPHNPGYAVSVNLAASQANHRWALLINPDAKLLPHTIAVLWEGATRHAAPVSGPRFYWDTQCRFKMPPAPGDHPWLAVALAYAAQNGLEAMSLDHYWQSRHEHFWRQTEPFVEPVLSGACLLLDLQWFARHGEPVFDEDYFLYYEDTDLCLRLTRKGILPLCVPKAGVIHYYNQAPNQGDKKNRYAARSREIFYQKHFGGLPSAPSIKSMAPLAPPEYTGESTQPLTFEYAPPEEGTSYFEIGLNPFFLPFIQSPATGKSHRLPDEVWGRLAPGQYFSRLRHPRLGTLKTWRWIKR